MSQLKSREFIEKAKSLLSEDYKQQFSGIINYTRIGLTTFLVLDMVKVSESEISFDVLKTYLPVLFKSVLPPERMMDILYEDKSDFICDFVEGAVYSKDVDHKPYLDFVRMAKEQGIQEINTSIADKHDSIMTNDLSSLYEQRKFLIDKYIEENAVKESDDFDIYDRYDVPTAATIIRSQMDKSKDVYNS